jgi:hypothetical protein
LANQRDAAQFCGHFEDGAQDLLTPEELRQQYAWMNIEERVGLPGK